MTLRSIWRITPEILKVPLRRVRDRVNRSRERAAWRVRRQRTLRRVAEPVTLPESDAARDTTLIFVPYAGVRPFYAIACVLARLLQDQGHRVLVTRCHRLFERCPAMDNARLPYEAAENDVTEVCLQCTANSFDMAEEYGIETIDLRALVTPAMRTRVREALAGAPRNLLQFEFDGEAIGQLSAVDLALAFKISNLEQVEAEIRAAWMQQLTSNLLAYLLVDDICRRYPIKRLLHVNDYGLALAATLAARKHAVPSIGASPASHRNVDFRRYMFWTDVWKPSSFRQLDAWKECRELALSPERVREIAEDELVRLGGVGSHIYSPAKSSESRDPRPGWGMATNRKLLVAYTSSLDEVVATRLGLDALGLTVPQRAQPFADQIEWLRAVMDYVAKSDHLQLMVRIHPREGVTKNNKYESEHLNLLREAFREPRPHCRIVWPEERISSYDLAEAADLALTSWSTIGLELARLGVPVLAAFNGSWAAMPQEDFLEWGATPPEYFRKLEMLPEAPATLERLGRAFRWYNLYHLGTTFDLGDIVPASSFTGLPEYRVPAEAATIEEIVIHQREACDINVARLLAAQRAESAAIESEELKRQLRRLIHFLIIGDESAPDMPLGVIVRKGPFPSIVGDAIDAFNMQEPNRLLEIQGPRIRYWAEISFRIDHPWFVRFSPMIARLAPLCATQIVEANEANLPSGAHTTSD